jgi:hypothetical protein
VELFGIGDALDNSRSVETITLSEQASDQQHTIYEIEYQEIENDEEMEAEMLDVPDVTVIKSQNDSEDQNQSEYIIETSQEKEDEFEVRRAEADQKQSEQEAAQNQASTSTISNQTASPSINYYQAPDSDERFLLSCAPALKRLTPRQNSYVRFSIQKLLFDVEFGNSEEADEGKSKKNK